MTKKVHREGRLVLAASLLLGGLLASAPAAAQTPSFNSGSTGADGPLDLTGTPANTTVEFDPVARNIDPERDNIFHFTTITIPANVTLRLTVKKMPNKPVYFLATGAVNIAGTINLGGWNGANRTTSKAARVAGVPGPGGFYGGQGGNTDINLGGQARDGHGPAGGLGVGSPGWSIANTGGWNNGRGAGAGGTKYLVPLFGGSGGGGGISTSYEMWGAGGGGGGGAILMASNVGITIAGGVYANGGTGGVGYSSYSCVEAGGSGAGGAIRLVAPAILGSGIVQASGGGEVGGYCPNSAAAAGRVRIEAFDNSSTFNLSGTNWSKGTPVSVYLPQTTPSIAVTSIGGVTVSTSPTGEFTPPDAVINTANPVEVQIRARNVPIGTVVKVHVFPLEGADLTVDSTPLTGTLQDASATASLTFPAGYSRGYVRAKW